MATTTPARPSWLNNLWSSFIGPFKANKWATRLLIGAIVLLVALSFVALGINAKTDVNGHLIPSQPVNITIPPGLGIISFSYYNLLINGFGSITVLLASITIIVMMKLWNSVGDALSNDRGVDWPGVLGHLFPFLALAMASYINQSICLWIGYSVMTRDKKTRQPGKVLLITTAVALLGINYLYANYPLLPSLGVQLAQRYGQPLLIDLFNGLTQMIHFLLNLGGVGWVIPWGIILYHDYQVARNKNLDATSHETFHSIYFAAALVSGMVPFTNFTGTYAPIKNLTSLFVPFAFFWVLNLLLANYIAFKELIKIRLTVQAGVEADGKTPIMKQVTMSSATKLSFPIFIAAFAIWFGHSTSVTLFGPIDRTWVGLFTILGFLIAGILMATPWAEYFNSQDPKNKDVARTTMENKIGDVTAITLPFAYTLVIPNNLIGMVANIVITLALIFQPIAIWFGMVPAK